MPQECLMSLHLNRDLDKLQKRILSLAGDVEAFVEKTISALFNRDAELARQIMDADSEIDAEENLIEEDCLKILALHQPVAIDLRRVATILKINSDLERMADLAGNIAERVYALSKVKGPVNIPSGLRNMADLASSMLRDALDAFVNLDAPSAKRVCRLDDSADRYNTEIILEVIEYMKKSADNVEPGLNLFSIVRQLERIADHATNIAEDVVYLVEGSIIRHHPEALRD
jgi:phosphate transport system protein